MNKWSTRRKRIIFILILLGLALLVALPSYLLLYESPTCYDGKQNGDETGVDCGGSCELLCTAESLPLLSKGDPRVLLISPNLYEVVAIFENANTSAEIHRAIYTVRLFASGNPTSVREIRGETYVPPGEEFGIFLGPFLVDGQVPQRAILEWEENTLTWQKTRENMPEISITNQVLSRENSLPRLEAVTENMDIEQVENIEFIALVYGENGNIFAASKTFLDSLSSGEKSTIVFTWPTGFQERVSSIRILSKVLPDRSFIR